MLKLSDLLNANKSVRYYYRPTKRFWYFLLIIIGYILLAILADKLSPETYFTSVYWRG